LSAASSAAATVLADAPLDFREESANDVSLSAGRRVEGDGDAMGDGLLISCQIGDDRVKDIPAEMITELYSVTLLTAHA